MFEELSKIARSMGYHGICPEFCEEFEKRIAEYNRFKSGMRQMFFGTDDQAEIEVQMQEERALRRNLEGYPNG